MRVFFSFLASDLFLSDASINGDFFGQCIFFSLHGTKIPWERERIYDTSNLLIMKPPGGEEVDGNLGWR